MTSFITINDFFILTGLDNNIDPNQCYPSIDRAQRVNLLPILTQGLYDKITLLIDSGDINDLQYASYYNLVVSYVQPALAMWAATYLPPALLLRGTNISVVNRNSEYSNSASLSDTQYLINQYRIQAISLGKALEKYINSNKSNFIEYSLGSCSTSNSRTTLGIITTRAARATNSNSSRHSSGGGFGGGYGSAVGPQGLKGDSGPQGHVGPQGIEGPSGGPIGPQGPIGQMGYQGPVGNSGAQGNSGPQGFKGDVGNVGNTGPQGNVGPQGVKGDTGGTNIPTEINQVVVGTGTNTAAGNATLVYSSDELALAGYYYKAALVFGGYSSVGSLNSGAGFMMGTGIKPYTNANTLIKLSNDYAHYVYTRYDRGIEFHTGIIGSINTVVDDTENIRMTILPNGNVGINGTSTHKLYVGGTVNITDEVILDDLSGTGTRMVVADSNGILSTSTAPINIIIGATYGLIPFMNPSSNNFTYSNTFRYNDGTLRLESSSNGNLAELIFGVGVGTSIYRDGGNLKIKSNSSTVLNTTSSGVILPNNIIFGWSNDANAITADVFLTRGSMGVLDLKNGSNPQTIRVFNYTDGANSEFLLIGSNNEYESDVYRISSEATGDGLLRDISIDSQTANTYIKKLSGIGNRVVIADGDGALSATSSLSFMSNILTVNNRINIGIGNSGFSAAGSEVTYLYNNQPRFGFSDALSIFSGGSLAWASTGNPTGTLDLRLFRDDANILAQRMYNEDTAQEFRIYNDSTLSNTEFLSIGSKNETDVYQIASEATGVGTSKNIRILAPNVLIGSTSSSSNIIVNGNIVIGDQKVISSYSTPYYGRLKTSITPMEGKSEVKFASKGSLGNGEIYFVIGADDSTDLGNNLLFGVSSGRAFITNAHNYTTQADVHIGGKSWANDGYLIVRSDGNVTIPIVGGGGSRVLYTDNSGNVIANNNFTYDGNEFKVVAPSIYVSEDEGYYTGTASFSISTDNRLGIFNEYINNNGNHFQYINNDAINSRVDLLSGEDPNITGAEYSRLALNKFNINFLSKDNLSTSSYVCNPDNQSMQSSFYGATTSSSSNFETKIFTGYNDLEYTYATMYASYDKDGNSKFISMGARPRAAFIDGCPVFDNNAAAIGGGLSANDLYVTSTGEIRMVI